MSYIFSLIQKKECYKNIYKIKKGAGFPTGNADYISNPPAPTSKTVDGASSPLSKINISQNKENVNNMSKFFKTLN